MDRSGPPRWGGPSCSRRLCPARNVVASTQPHSPHALGGGPAGARPPGGATAVGMNLVGPQGQQDFNLFAWKLLIDLARRNGWEPAGTEPPAPGAWPEEEDEPGEPEGESEAEGEEGEPEDSEGGAEVVRLTPEELEAYRVQQDNPILQAILSFFPPPGDRLLSSYFSNDGRRVTADDARALADALERGLPDIPDHDALAHKTVEIPQEPGERFIRLGTPVSPEEGFSGRHKARLREFIAFCR